MGGKSGNKKKKPSAAKAAEKNAAPAPAEQPEVNPEKAIIDSARALREQANTLFKSKEYQKALDFYDQAIALLPGGHSDRAVLHSNKAAVLLSLQPPAYVDALEECNNALTIQPRHIRALLRRARAFEALGKFKEAQADLDLLLSTDPASEDAKQLQEKVKSQMNKPKAPPSSVAGRKSATSSPLASPGADTGRAMPSLPERKAKRKSTEADGAAAEAAKAPKLKAFEVPIPKDLVELVSEVKAAMEENERLLEEEKRKAAEDAVAIQEEAKTEGAAAPAKTVKKTVKVVRKKKVERPAIPLKLVYQGHDIRKTELPANGGLKTLREVVQKRYPGSKAVLVKYQDEDGDWITITSNEELRGALEICGYAGKSAGAKNPEEGAKKGPVRLEITEVPEEQEPAVEEGGEDDVADYEEEEVDEEVEEEVAEEAPSGAAPKAEQEEGAAIQEDFLYHLSLAVKHKLGMTLDYNPHDAFHQGHQPLIQAIDETLQSDEAVPYYEQAVAHYKEVIAGGYMQWGHIHKLLADKVLTEASRAADKQEKLKLLLRRRDEIQSHYNEAHNKFQQANAIAPDLVEATSLLVHNLLDMAKTHLMYAELSVPDLSLWNSTQVFKLVGNAITILSEPIRKLELQIAEDEESLAGEEKARAAKLAEAGDSLTDDDKKELDQRVEELRYFVALAKERRTQLKLTMAEILLEQSSFEYKTGKPTWVQTLELAWERFRSTECNILVVKAVLLPNHEWIKQQLEKAKALAAPAAEEKKDEAAKSSGEAAPGSSEGPKEGSGGPTEEKHENGAVEKGEEKGAPEKAEEVHANGGVESPEPKANGEGSASKKKKNKKQGAK